MNNEPPSHPPPRTLVVAAYAAIYLVWGSTYLAIRVAVETLPPFLMSGCRFLLAGAVMFAWLRVRGAPPPGGNAWRNAVLVGFLLLVGGNGLVTWAEQTVTSSLTALIIAITPVWFALMDWLRPAGNRPRGQTVIGIAAGFAGVAMLVTGGNSATQAGSINPAGVLALVGAGISWAGGSLYGKHTARGESPWMNAAMQMVAGGAMLLLVSVLAGEPAHATWSRFSVRSMAAFAYLLVFGSWLAFSAYVWLLKVSSPSRVATYAYVNPVIAVFLGWLLLNEPIHARVLWAAAVILVGVIIISLPAKTAD
jgi:drug/metabolite transporter (DMT)-like permease